MYRTIRTVLLAAMVVAGLSPRVASAQTTYSWTGTASGSWSGAANWTTPTPTGGDSTGILSFTYPGASIGSITATNDQGNPFLINRIQLNTTTASTFLIGSAASNTIQFTGTGAGITNSGLGPVTLNSTINLNANVNYTSTGVGLVTLSGVVSETSGPRSITFSRATAPINYTGAYIVNWPLPSFTGGVTLDRGMIIMPSGTSGVPFGIGGLSVTANGGTWAITAALTLGATAGNIGVTTGGTLRLTGGSGLTLPSTSQIQGGGNLSILGSSTNTFQSSSSISGSLLADISPYSQITSGVGTLNLNGNNGALASMTSYEIRAGGTLAPSSNSASSVPNSNRLSDTAPIGLRSASLALTGAVTAVTLIETVGPLSISGYSTITIASSTGAASTTLQADSINRTTDHGTMLFRGNNLGTTGAGNHFIKFSPLSPPPLFGGGGSAGTKNINIIPWALADISPTGTGQGMATYGANGVRPLTTDTEIQADLLGTPDSNVRLTTAVTNSAAVTVNSLVCASGGGIGGTGTITVTSGAMATLTSNSITNNISFGAEGIWHVLQSITYAGNLTGSNGFTKSGNATLTLNGDNSGLTGDLVINGNGSSVLAFNSANALPGNTKIIVVGTSASNVTGAGINYTAAGAPLTIGRNIEITGWFRPQTSTTSPLTLSGNISGSGGLIFTTNGATLLLTGTNTYTGPTQVFQGTLRINGDTALGAGTSGFDFGNGNNPTLVLDGNWTTSRPINISNSTNSATLDTGSFNAVLNGPLTNYSSAATLTTASSTALTKLGIGTLTLHAGSSFSSPLTLTAGQVALAQSGALLSATYSLASGTTLTLDNTTVPNGTGTGPQTISRIRNDASITLNNATFKQIGNAAQQITEALGTMTYNGSAGVLRVEASGGFESRLTLGNIVLGSNSLLVQGTALGSAGTGSVGRVFLTNFNGVAVSNGQLLANVTVEDLNVPGIQDFGVYDTTRGIRFVDIATDFTNGVAIQNGPSTNLSTTANFRVNPTIVNPVPVLDPNNTINALRFAPNGEADYNAPGNSTLTITSGILFTEFGGAASITQGGTGVLTLTAGSAVLSVTANANLSIAGTLGGAGGITKTGAGTLALNGQITNSGTVTVNGGTLSLLQSTTVANLAGNALGTMNLNSSTLTITGTNSSTANTITGAGGLIYNPASAAVLILGGNNSFSGGFVGNGNARLIINHPNALGTGPVDLLAQNASSTVSSPTLGYNFGSVGASGTVANNLALSNGVFNVVIAQNNAALAGQTLRLTGVLSGGTSGTVMVIEESGLSRANVVVLDNPNNSITGLWQINSGTLAITSDGALGNPANGVLLSNASVAPQGDLRFDLGNITLASTRTVTANSSGSRINTNGFTATIAGVFAGISTFEKIGTGTLVLANAANTNTSTTTVSAGTLRVTGILPTSTNTITVNSAAHLDGTGNVARPISVSNGGTVAGGVGNAGTLTLSGANSKLTFVAGANFGISITNGATNGGLGSGASSGGIGATPNLTTNTYIDQLAGGVAPVGLSLATYRVDMNSTTFATPFTPHSYLIGRVVGDQSSLNLITPGQFVFNNGFPGQDVFIDVSLTGDANGYLYLNFTPIPEPALLALMGLGVIAYRRRS